MRFVGNRPAPPWQAATYSAALHPPSGATKFYGAGFWPEGIVKRSIRILLGVTSVLSAIAFGIAFAFWLAHDVIVTP